MSDRSVTPPPDGVSDPAPVAVLPDGGQLLFDEHRSGISQEAVFSTLSSQRRRLILRHLFATPGAVSVRDLTTAVAAAENGVDESELTYKQRKRVYTSLHQTHLPKLRNVGLIEYDSNPGIVELTDGSTVVEPFFGNSTTRRWCDYYLALGLGLTTLAIVAWADIAMFATIPDIVVGGLAAVAVLTVASWHAITTR